MRRVGRVRGGCDRVSSCRSAPFFCMREPRLNQIRKPTLFVEAGRDHRTYPYQIILNNRMETSQNIHGLGGERHGLLFPMSICAPALRHLAVEIELRPRDDRQDT